MHYLWCLFSGMLIRRFDILLILLLVLVSCARPVLPEGGPKDTTPPRLSVEKSTPNKLTYFTKQTLTFTFDEFIVLDKADQQVLISPPLEYRPTISVKDKSVVFRFDDREALKDNTTYIINFGESVKDYTEGNIVPDFQYVFSTGALIDSLELTASIVNADEGKPAENTVLMLYRDLSDSAVYKSLPDYAARTDKNGQVRLRYMQPGEYQAVALKDENQNYKYDLTNEKAGFSRETIRLPYEGRPLSLQIFAKEQPVRITSVDSASNNRIRFVIDPSAAGVTVRPLDVNSSSQVDIGIKNIDVYYGDTLRTIGLIMQRPGFEPDTIRRQLSRKAAARKLRVAEEQPEVRPLPFVPGGEAQIRFNIKIAGIDTSKMSLYTANGIVQLPYTAAVDTIDANILLLKSRWAADSTYVLKMRSGAVYDILDNKNDSTAVRFKIADPATLSTIILKVDSLNAGYDYSIQIAKGNELIRKWIVTGQSTFNAEVGGLPAETYQINILEDRNKNGRIDKGSFTRKEDPEKVYTKKLEQLRQNWSVEIEISLSEFEKAE